jgi:hypothetical protein
VATLLRGILAPTLAKLRMANNTRILAVEENVLDVLFLEVSALQNILQIIRREA